MPGQTQFHSKQFPQKIETKAGICQLNEKKVTPIKGNGILRVSENQYGGFTVTWRKVVGGSDNDSEELYIYGNGENDFHMPKRLKNGVFMLRFKQSKSKQLYWSQEEDVSKIEEFITRVNKKLNDEDDPQEDAKQQPIATTANTTAPPQPNAMQQGIWKFFQEQYQKKKSPGFEKIIKSKDIKKFMDQSDQKILEPLIQQLPEGQQTKEGLYDNLYSPQFRQILQTFSAVCGSPQFPTLLASLGLNVSFANNSNDNIDALIKALEAKAKEEEEKQK